MQLVLRGLLLAILSLLVLPVSAFVVTPLDQGKLAVEIEADGDTPEAALREAKVQAVRGSVGRVFLEDRLTLADDLLVKYLNNYGDQFVTAVEISKSEFIAGRNHIKARIFVDYPALERDLEQKRFLYTPAYKPRFAAFMTERLDGRIATNGVAREALSDALNNLGMRKYDADLTNPPSTTDISGDQFLLQAAIVSSQRAGVEVIVSGECKTTLAQQKKLYFDDYWFYDSELSASIIRVDTGEVLFKAKGYGSASSKSQDDAIQLAINRAAEGVARELVGHFDKFWPVVVQGRAKYEILFQGVDDELIRIVTQNIERLGRETKVHLRKKFDRSAVLSVEYSGTKEELLENLKSCSYPTLYILNPEADGRFEVQVSS